MSQSSGPWKEVPPEDVHCKVMQMFRNKAGVTITYLKLFPRVCICPEDTSSMLSSILVSLPKQTRAGVFERTVGNDGEFFFRVFGWFTISDEYADMHFTVNTG
jgi:hypothetical protein